MYEVETHDMTPEFLECWKAAGIHISNQVQSGLQSWLKATPYPPFLEHLSFRLGNQNFYIRVTDVSGSIDGPGSERGLFAIADGSNGHACFMPMRKKLLGGWVPDRAGWGLVDARTGKDVDPIDLVSNEKIEMSDWELQDFAVQVVRTQLEKEGFELMSWQGNPNVDPAIWFIGESRRPFLLNAYRVLLTRARQGMAIFIPPGENNDHTRPSAYYEDTFNYMREIGIDLI